MSYALTGVRHAARVALGRTVRPTLFAAACSVIAVSAAHAQNAFRRDAGAAGFTSNSLARNDDESTGLVNIGFSANFFGTTYTQLYVNNNGNVTFVNPLVTYTPFALTGSTGTPIIASFFADVDTRGAASAVTQYGIGTVDGHAAFGIDWDGVGYFSSHTDKLNVFQQILIDRSDTGFGNFDIEFNYNQVRWETGDFSGGSGGLGGTSVAAGYSSGSGAAGTYAQLQGSLVNGALIDGGANALVSHSQGSAVLGRYVFQVRNGQVIVPPPVTTAPEPSTVALVGAGVLAVAGAARRRRARG